MTNLETRRAATANPSNNVLSADDEASLVVHETAQILDLSIAVLKTRLQRARLRLRDLLDYFRQPNGTGKSVHLHPNSKKYGRVGLDTAKERLSMKTAGQPPNAKAVKVLLISENSQGSSYLKERLMKKGCGCEFATCLGEASSRIRASDYDLVLSATRLPDGGAFPLMDLLEGSNATLFYFYPVEEGCWWLPGLRHGRKCFGSSALRPSDFIPMLHKIIDEIVWPTRL